MPIEREKIRGKLIKTGFREKIAKHDYYYLYLNGKKSSIFTFLSQGSGYREISDELVSAIAHQIRLTKKEFLDFVKCTLTPEKYFELLRQRGEIQ
jgi:CRISPR-associated protein Cas8b1/Cst1 subtype I-B